MSKRFVASALLAGCASTLMVAIAPVDASARPRPPATTGASDAQLPALSALASCNYDEAAEYGVNGGWPRLPMYYNSMAGTDNPDCVMGLHSSGVGVKALQTTLNRCYAARLSVDGIFGSGTRGALISAQTRAGVSADGVYGPRTRDAIKWGTDVGYCPRYYQLTW